LFWNEILDNASFDYIHDDNSYEVKKIIEKYHSDFTTSQLEKLVIKIKKVSLTSKSRDNLDHYQHRLHLLFGTEGLFKAEINEYNKKYPPAPYLHPSLENDPIESSFSLNKKFDESIPEIIEFINYFRSIKSQRLTAENICHFLSNKVKENPSIFIPHLNGFIEFDCIYVNGLLSGFRYAWQGNKLFDWSALLDFIYNYIRQRKFNFPTME
jgi:hypothetical protein